MAGGSINHNRITRNLERVLDGAFRGYDYEVFMNDLRLWIAQEHRYFYPDVMVIEGMPVFYEERRDTVLNLVLIAEVLSKSTKNYARGEKFEDYRSIPELKEYMTIDIKVSCRTIC